MKIPLLRGIWENIGSLTKTADCKLYKTSLKKFKKSIDFSQKMWYYNIKERGSSQSTGGYDGYSENPMTYKPKGVIPMGL
ncbi:MAG: hypothetical protein K2O14_10105 [Oscillospiraceae bacterium]|nr:hypothetical protein [Oscillospiraceae bacterium]